MLSKEKREQFEELLRAIFVIYNDAYGTDRETSIAQIMIKTWDLAEEFGAEPGEILAINHNSHCYVMNQPKQDVDKWNEEYKLGQLLHDVDI